MTETFHHLSAKVDGHLKDILVHEEEFTDCDSDPANFFVLRAKNATDNGIVELRPLAEGHILPDIFG